MKTDLYTRVVLSVIAVCLVVLCFRGIEWLPSARAGLDESGSVGEPQRVVVVGFDGGDFVSGFPVNLVGVDDAVMVPVKIQDVQWHIDYALPVKNVDR